MIRHTVLALAGLLVFAAAGTAMAGDPPALPYDEPYPAAYLHKADADEARKAEALRTAYLLLGRGTDAGLPESSPAPGDWLRLGPHSLLDRVFPGAAFYATPPDVLGGREFAAVSNGGYYALPDDVVRLLYDCGMRFGDDDMPTWLRAIGIVCAKGILLPDSAYTGPFERQEAIRQELNDRMYRGELPYLPELTLAAVELDTGAVDAEHEWQRGKVHNARIWVRRTERRDNFEVQIGVGEIGGKQVRIPTSIDFKTRLSPPQP